MISYITADATIRQVTGPLIIAHISNDSGMWGAGFSGALSLRYIAAEVGYRAWNQMGHATLGQVQYVGVRDRLWVANMVAQAGVRFVRRVQHEMRHLGPPPIRYQALRDCLTSVAHMAVEKEAIVQMPRIGVGLAGGTWDAVEPIIAATLGAAGLTVLVCDQPV